MKNSFKKITSFAVASVLSLSVATTAFAAKPSVSDNTAVTAASLTAKKTSSIITKSQAEKIALADSGYTSAQVSMKKTKLDNDDGEKIYEVEFFVITDTHIIEYDYEIDAYTGKIVDIDYDRDAFGTVKAKVNSVAKTSAVISWNKVNEADGYVIYKCDSTGAYTQVATTKSRTYKFTGLKSGTQYTFYVKAYIIEDGIKAFSKQYAPVSFTTQIAKATGVKATSPKKNTVKVTFTKVTGASKYLVVLSTSSSFTSPKKKTVKTNSATFTGIKQGKTVYVKVYAYDKSGVKGEASSVKTVVVK